SPTAGGTDLPTIAHNYWLRPTSPAIDAGLDTTAQPYPAVTTDFDALPRPIGPQLDIGMFEATTAGDIDHDADVDLDDFDLLASGLSGPAAPTAIPAADLNDDGHCDLADFAILAANFTAQP
ncbi:MAG: choice-of-anchor Q domain-containing protein, partial [Phycisphaerae bacterium]